MDKRLRFRGNFSTEQYTLASRESITNIADTVGLIFVYAANVFNNR